MFIAKVPSIANENKIFKKQNRQGTLLLFIRLFIFKKQKKNKNNLLIGTTETNREQNKKYKPTNNENPHCFHYLDSLKQIKPNKNST